MSVIGNGKVFGKAWMNVIGASNWSLHPNANSPISAWPMAHVIDGFNAPLRADQQLAEFTAGNVNTLHNTFNTPRSITMRLSGKNDDSGKKSEDASSQEHLKSALNKLYDLARDPEFDWVSEIEVTPEDRERFKRIIAMAEQDSDKD